MTAVVILGGLALLLLLPLGVAAVRQPTMAMMAMRNISRRAGEAVLVIVGGLLGTAIITSSLVVGDVIEGSFADVARTQYGPVDITLTPPPGVPPDQVLAAVQAARIDGIDGLLLATTSSASLEAPRRQSAVPQVQVVELDVPAARDFGSDAAITGLAEIQALAVDTIIVNQPTAQRLGVQAGDALRLHAYDSSVDLVVSAVVPKIGLAGYGDAIVAPGTLTALATQASGATAPPRASDAVVVALRAAVADLPGVEVAALKAAVLDDARVQGAGLTEVFSSIGAFSVLAGILLLVNLFVMLAEERKTQLGILRAVGFTRRRLIRAFAMEGAVYAVIAAVAGAMTGLGIGWLVAVVAGPIFRAEQAASYPLVIKPGSLAIGATMGLVISLLTIWATSLRIARLNIIRAIRDIPEPKQARIRPRALALGAVGVLAGSAIGLAAYLGDNALGLCLGIPIAAFSALPLLRRILPERTARLLAAGTVMGWGLAVYPLFPDLMGAADMIVFVVQGVVLTAGAVSLASGLDRVWAFAIQRLGRGDRGLAPRLGIAYPLAHPFRTSMLLGMFSLVVFMVTIITTVSTSLDDSTAASVERITAGFDIVLDTNPANPAEASALSARPDVAAVAGLVPGSANFTASYLDTPRAWPITGFDADLMVRGVPALFTRDDRYTSDEAVYRAVLADPTLAIVPEDFLVAGVDVAVLGVGDSFTLVEGDGTTRVLTIAAIGQTDWFGNGALVSRELTTAVLGGQDIASRFYLAVAPGTDPDKVSAAVNAALLPQGADARSLAGVGAEGARALIGFLALLRGFLGLGLLVGIAGLGVVMVRAVRERRHEIGMLRAMGLRSGIVRAAMLSEAALIAVQGTVIGAVLGLITTRQLLAGPDSFGDVGLPFVVSWGGLVLILVLPLAAAVAATAWPASRAAAIRPAVALRNNA